MVAGIFEKDNTNPVYFLPLYVLRIEKNFVEKNPKKLRKNRQVGEKLDF